MISGVCMYVKTDQLHILNMCSLVCLNHTSIKLTKMCKQTNTSFFIPTLPRLLLRWTYTGAQTVRVNTQRHGEFSSWSPFTRNSQNTCGDFSAQTTRDSSTTWSQALLPQPPPGMILSGIPQADVEHRAAFASPAQVHCHEPRLEHISPATSVRITRRRTKICIHLCGGLLEAPDALYKDHQVLSYG